jgi:hypothetical protein
MARRNKTTRKPPPAVTLTVGGRTWQVEGTRLSSSSATTTFPPLWVARRTDTLFLFAPTLGGRAFGLFCVTFGAGILGLLGHGLTVGWFKLPQAEFWPVAGIALALGFNCTIALVACAVGLKLMTQTIRFDRTAGTVCRRWLLRMQDSRPLQDVVAVQYLDVGRIRTTGGSEDSQPVHQFQLNLVLEGPPGLRVNLCTEPEGPSVRDAARELAAFLAVPLVEQHQNGRHSVKMIRPEGASEGVAGCAACGWTYDESGNAAPIPVPETEAVPKEPIEVRYVWTAEERATALRLALVVWDSYFKGKEQTWFPSLLGPLFIGAVFLALYLGGPWAALGVLAAPVLGLAVLAGVYFYHRLRRPGSGLIGMEWRFTVTESGLEWWHGEQRLGAVGWEDVGRCHRADKGFVVCSGVTAPIWLPVHGFRDPEAVNNFARLARRKARAYTGEEEPEAADADGDKPEERA